MRPGALGWMAVGLLLAGCGAPPPPREVVERTPMEEVPVDEELAQRYLADPAAQQETSSLRRQRSIVSSVFIDAGHGGEEHGARGAGGSAEKVVVLDIAMRLKRELEGRFGLTVHMSREDDSRVGLRRRTVMANESGADLFISIHANAAGASARGVEVYTLDLASDASAERLARRENELVGPQGSDEDRILEDLAVVGNTRYSRALADRVQEGMIEELRTLYDQEVIVDRGARSALFAVLVGAEMPAVLVEVGFLSHPEEERMLRTPAHRALVSRGIADGVEGPRTK